MRGIRSEIRRGPIRSLTEMMRECYNSKPSPHDDQQAFSRSASRKCAAIAFTLGRARDMGYERPSWLVRTAQSL
jgi:hypothetical protein